MSSDRQQQQHRRLSSPTSLLCLAVIAALLVGGYWLYRLQEKTIVSEQGKNLEAIARLKINQILSWRQERMADARMNSSGMVRTLALEWQRTGKPELLEDVRQRLTFFKENEGYFNMLLADPQGRLVISLTPRVTEIEPEETSLLNQVLETKQAVLGNLFLCRNCNRLHLNVAAPVMDGDEVAFVLLLVSDPATDLYPTLQTWPTDHANAETLLINRDGDQAVVLNQPRHLALPPLALHLPLSRTDNPAVQALLGTQGIVRGKDYRGQEVLATLNAIPGTPWFMETKMDAGELAAQARMRTAGLMLLVIMATLLASGLVRLSSLSRQKRLSEALLHEEHEHRQTREEIRATLYGIGEGVIATDAHGLITRMNPIAEKLTGWRESEALGHPLTEIYKVIREETGQPMEIPVDRVLREGTIVGMSNSTLLIARDGSQRPIADSGAPIRSATGEITGVVLVFRDQSKKRAMEKARIESTRRYTDLVETISDFLWESGPDHRHTYASPRSLDMLGYTPEEFVGTTWFDLLDKSSPSQTIQDFTDLVAREQPYSQLCLTFRTKEGQPVVLESSATPVFDPDGLFVGYRGISRDITERKRTEEEQKRLEAQLLQAQKMEVVGRLAGGVAHDFNNMLTVISSYVEMSLNELDQQSPLYKRLFEVHLAARHSADLTRQLLAFARKQMISPRILDLNETISGALKMLHRLIGENINLQWCPGPDLWAVRMDSTQIGQILANLAVNARDAIGEVGNLSIATANRVLTKAECAADLELQPGEYVLLSVSDTGCGMDQATVARIFEPFFTTKGDGRGTGLGLATVYGIIKQNQGTIQVESQPGQGTVFRIFLPRARFGSTPLPPSRTTLKYQGRETILLVEDEGSILDLGTYILEQRGYTVLAARTPAAAMAMALEHPEPIDLLLTDVIMPEMNGRELAREILRLRPMIKILYMSGYTADIIAHHGALDPEMQFLEKPFTGSGLSQKVRETLDRKEQGQELPPAVIT